MSKFDAENVPLLFGRDTMKTWKIAIDMNHETVFSKIYNKGVFSLSGHMMIPLHEFGKVKDKSDNKGKESNVKEESSIGTFVVEVLEEDKKQLEMDFDAENSDDDFVKYRNDKEEFDAIAIDDEEAVKQDIAEDEPNHKKEAANVNYE